MPATPPAATPPPEQPPPKPLPSNKKPEPEGPSIGGLLANRFLDGAKDLPARRRWLALALAMVLVAAGAVVVVGWGLVTDWWTAKPRAERQQEVERQIDLSKEPFIARADYDRSPPPGNWKFVLDRTLTAAEAAKLEVIPFDEDFGAAVWELLRPLGGRALRYPTTMNVLPPGFDQVEAYWADATHFKLHIFSERSTRLSIVDMHAVDVSCRPPSAKTVVEYPGEGESEYAGVLFDLTSQDPAPFITDSGDDQGKPYFDDRKIDLGGGALPGALAVEAMVRAQTCDWRKKARYRDSTKEGGGEITLGDGDKPFTAEALPPTPEQYWLLDTSSLSLVSCHEQPAQSACAERTRARGKP